VSAPFLLVIALAGLCTGFALIYFFCRRLDNYGFVDVAWAYSFTLLAVFFACFGPGWPVRRLLCATLVGLWSLRLGTHLLRRVAGHHPVEDGRYVQLRQDWAANFGSKMFGFFQLQAVSAVLLGLLFLLPACNATTRLHPLELAGAVLWLLAVLGETLADAQLAAFRKQAAGSGRVCDVGLWRYSRHPNYFFEWLVWVAYFVFVLPSPWGWIGIISPVSILYLLLRVTGIPLTEQQVLRSKGEAYRRYQQTTSAFVPWFPTKLS